MENIYRLFLIYVVIKYLFFITITLKGWDKSFIEVCLTFLSFSIVFYGTKDFGLTLLMVETDLIVTNLLMIINIVAIKEVSFWLLVSIVQDKSFARIFLKRFNKKRLCKKLNSLKDIDFGPKLKHGIPAMANKTHSKTRVKFDRNGFPKFKSYYTIHLKMMDYKKSREFHFEYANKLVFHKSLKSEKIRKMFTKKELEEMKRGETPDKYTWHHHQNKGKMQLVSRKTHEKVNHIGGYSIWGGISS